MTPSDLAQEIERELFRNVNIWYPHTMDSRGGYHTAFDRAWKRIPYETKGIVHQSRMVWTAAEMIHRCPDQRETLLPCFRHGTKFLRETMWDAKCGGFFWEVKEDGTPFDDNAFMKHAYGEAFAIYGFANAYRATQDEDDLRFAKETFCWLDRHAHDNKHGGYYEALF